MSYNIATFLNTQAKQRPDSVALRFANLHSGPGREASRELTFRELNRLSDRYARGFEAAGIGRGVRTLVLSKPNLDFFAFMFGLFKVGAVPVLLDPGMGIKNILKCVEQIAPEAVIASPIVHAIRTFVRSPFKSAKTHVTVGTRWIWGGRTLAQVLSDDDEPYALASFDASNEAAIVFTSGSTGAPKGVSFTHGAFHSVVGVVHDLFGYSPGDIHMEAFASFVFFDLCLGMTTVVPDADLTKLASADPMKMYHAIHDNRCTSSFASPVVWAKLTRYCEANDLNLVTLERVVTTGAPIHADMHRRIQRLTAPDAELFTPYGATECLTVACIATDEILNQTWSLTAQGEGTCVGRPTPEMEVFIIPITDEPIANWDDSLALPPGELGEITVRGPAVSPEYKDLPKANALAKIHSEAGIMHRMGDLGRLDNEGRLWFCGRKAHALRTADGLVPAVPVEGIFNEHPAVFRCALIGVGDQGAELPLLLLELEAEVERLSDDLKREILDLSRGTRWENTVKEVRLYEAGFPVDPRHNSKIKRGLLKSWADKELNG